MTVRAARADYLARGLRLEFFSLGYNLLEAAVGLAAGLAAGSVALIGFGLDSIVEGSSAAVLVWRLSAEKAGRRTSEDVERRAVRFVSLAFFLLAAYVGVSAIVRLFTAVRPEESPAGIVLAIASLIVMPILARRKSNLASALDSRSLQADSRQTTLCTYLSAFLLVGLVANAVAGWWWADPIAAVGISILAASEGRELWHTEDLC